jgi:hypothetical protein
VCRCYRLLWTESGGERGGFRPEEKMVHVLPRIGRFNRRTSANQALPHFVNTILFILILNIVIWMLQHNHHHRGQPSHISSNHGMEGPHSIRGRDTCFIIGYIHRQDNFSISSLFWDEFKSIQYSLTTGKYFPEIKNILNSTVNITHRTPIIIQFPF